MLSGEGLVALVTGANRGIGFEVARQLGRLGYVPIVASRDRELGTAAVERLAADGVVAQCVELDLTDEATVRAAAEWVDRRYGRLDALINNAAIAVDGLPSQLPIDSFRRTFETNVIGVFAVTTVMLPLLRAARNGRIVNLSSGSASLSLTSSDWPAEWNAAAYPSSKSAVNALTVQFAIELRSTAIKVNAVDPGYTLTEMSPGATRTAAEAAAVVVRFATLDADGPTGGFFNAEGPIPW
ncbi:short-subunit dehydrogenase [Kribbella sp. VKM Ac-2527]|uniref:Short-subunit dehydrogenase n=1 Tax=Kribbella caucasensis TaxID=2512215 RepID=A0A4R6JDB5_9ACTN|nr:SDR family NAD(P)-dependent oxidoreductase [Kribbella sp. VKM Ac-2527]TDO33814.1 short-subunit dehydrogenase [Kribbella sp. VKM Ac-2527]